jgi:hypothetical protein
MTDYRAMRQAFMPDPLNLIIVAESPPESGEYFYDDRNRGVLFREMMKLIGASPQDKIDGLVPGERLAAHRRDLRAGEQFRRRAAQRDHPA